MPGRDEAGAASHAAGCGQAGPGERRRACGAQVLPTSRMRRASEARPAFGASFKRPASVHGVAASRHPRARLGRAMAQPPPRGGALPTDKLSAAAFGAASQALVAHTGGSLPGALGGKPGGAQDVDLEDLFSLRRPKNFVSGASSGLQSVAKGAPTLAALRQRRGCRGGPEAVAPPVARRWPVTRPCTRTARRRLLPTLARAPAGARGRPPEAVAVASLTLPALLWQASSAAQPRSSPRRRWARGKRAPSAS
jgi:hypothetical protein